MRRRCAARNSVSVRDEAPLRGERARLRRFQVSGMVIPSKFVVPSTLNPVTSTLNPNLNLNLNLNLNPTFGSSP